MGKKRVAADSDAEEKKHKKQKKEERVNRQGKEPQAKEGLVRSHFLRVTILY
jgi:hypothetical protein